MAVQRYCFALDLKADERLIAEYEAHHRAVWPPVEEQLRASGIEHLEIYRVENRLFMIMDVTEDFSLEGKAQRDAADPLVQQWETLMATYQQALPTARPGEKWLLMKPIYTL